MRTFEVALILVNLLSLFAGPSKKQSKSVLFGLAGMNLIVFVCPRRSRRFPLPNDFRLHFRLTVYDLRFIEISGQVFRNQNRKNRKGFCNRYISCLLLAITTLMAYALPVFELPKPTGSYEVGVQYIYLTDDKRHEPFLKGSTEKREIAVKNFLSGDKRSFQTLFRLFSRFS
ncbi:hypothetical protein [Cohnella candidum]|uniref:Uncharacterized protein n=1 Tax=Cohnella candidum TaxID=2674991 RepID=A0A3G3K4R2_9BACL|nr:hypothetical protein [Cohnella candidum]AYQ75390.1 hypothetical protein EAV92_24310 [Cohnella candidum]